MAQPERHDGRHQTALRRNQFIPPPSRDRTVFGRKPGRHYSIHDPASEGRASLEAGGPRQPSNTGVFERMLAAAWSWRQVIGFWRYGVAIRPGICPFQVRVVLLR